MDTSKLAELQKGVRIGGKGAPRRKMRRAPPPKVNYVEDKKITSTLKRLNVHSIENIEEVNLFKDDGSVLHISQPKVQASVYANTFAVQGRVQERDLSEMLPNVLPQLGPQSQPLLQKLVEKMGGIQALQNAVPADFPGKHMLRPNAASASFDAAPADNIHNEEDEEDDDDVPDLVENFDEDMD